MRLSRVKVLFLFFVVMFVLTIEGKTTKEIDILAEKIVSDLWARTPLHGRTITNMLDIIDNKTIKRRNFNSVIPKVDVAVVESYLGIIKSPLLNDGTEEEVNNLIRPLKEISLSNKYSPQAVYKLLEIVASLS